MIRLRDGSDVTLIATGNMVTAALDAADILAEEGIAARVLDCHTIKPIDEEEILRSAEETRAIVTAEDHNVIGGLGSAVSEVVASGCPAVVRRVGLRDCFADSGRDYRKLLAHYGLTAEAIAVQAKAAIAGRNLAAIDG